MKKIKFPFACAIVIFGFLVMMGISAAAENEITAEQFTRLIELLNNLDHGKTALVAVQGDREIEITDLALMKKISLSGVKTAFYFKDVKTGVKRLIAAYEAGQTTKSTSRKFWGMVCSGAGLCNSCAQLFGDNPCK
jgi:hypothetical protein